VGEQVAGSPPVNRAFHAFLTAHAENDLGIELMIYLFQALD
jgi:hypothetical protein